MLYDRLIKLKELGHNKVVKYNSERLSSLLFHLNFLHKHKYNCIIEPYQFHSLKNEDDFIKELLPKIIKCVKNGSKIIAIPILFSNHANMLIYNVELNELYRFEPHGEKYEKEELFFGSKDVPDEQLNKLLNNFTNNEMVIKELKKIKYISPVESCPKIKKSVRSGFQAMENYYLQIILSEKEMNELNKSEGGFCQVWSWFMLDLIMLNPNKTISDIYKEAHKALENDPYSFRSVIRGFILEVESELININKDLSIEKLASGDIPTKNKIFDFYQKEIKRLDEEKDLGLNKNLLKQKNIYTNNIQQKEMEAPNQTIVKVGTKFKIGKKEHIIDGIYKLDSSHMISDEIESVDINNDTRKIHIKYNVIGEKGSRYSYPSTLRKYFIKNI